MGLELAQISKSFGGRAVVDRLSLSLPTGKLLTLLGPSGCGKTTLLRMIAGFIEPTNGHIYIDGDDVTNVMPEKRATSIMFQSYALFPHMTVYENVAFGLRLRKIGRPEIHRRVTDMLSLVHMDSLADRFPAQLSGGQQQRAALARSLVIGPKVLLLDEPFAALDRDLRERMQIELRKLQQDLGITMVVVTHDQGEAMILSDYVAVMNNGRIDQFDEPYLIYSRPQTTFVASFMGIPNFFPGKMHVTGSSRTVTVGPYNLPVLSKNVPSGSEDEVTIALRREEIDIVPTDHVSIPSNCVKIPGTVRFARRLGSQVAYEVETAIGVVHVLSMPRDFAMNFGSAVSLHISAEHVIVVRP